MSIAVSPHRLVGVVTLVVCLLAWTAGPASAVDDSLGKYVMHEEGIKFDKDRVAFGDGTLDVDGTFTSAGRMTWYHAGATGELKGQLTGKLGGADCRFLQVTWKYADTSTDVTQTPRSCGVVPVDLDSTPRRDVMYGEIRLYRIDPSNPVNDTVLAGIGTSFVTTYGDNGGDGTCYRLDRDQLSMSSRGANFIGTVTYFCDGGRENAVRARVTGTVVWKSPTPSTRSRLRVRMATTGAALTFETPIVSMVRPIATVSFTSGYASDVLGVRGALLTAPLVSTGTFTEQVARQSELGRT